MRRIQWNPCAWILAVALLALPVAAGAASSDFATLSAGGDAVVWQVQGDYEAVVLRVAGPGGVSSERFAAGQMPQFSLFDRAGGYLVDGGYNWELTVVPRIDASTRRLMDEARRTGDTSALAGRIPARRVQSGYFTILGGSVVSGGEEERGAATDAARAGGDFEAISDGALSPITDRTTISGDLTVYNSLCVGSDCAANESYGADSIRLKENNLRIHFDDTSNSASFPNTDWRIEANETTNGGANWFTINDASNSRRSFTIEANAPTDAMYLDDAGRLGLGTSAPVVEIHVKDGDTPTLRLEQDGSSGFSPQIWDVAGNETNFFVRDVTGGSQLPFKIQPGADHNSLVIAADNDIGIGTLTPSSDIDGSGRGASVHIRRANGNASLFIEEASTTSATRVQFKASNLGRPRIQLANTAVVNTDNQIWNFEVANSGNFVISRGGSGTDEFQLMPDGDLVLTGDCSDAAGGGGCTPDYVFEPDYQFRTLDELAAFVAENKHLPNVPSAAEIEKNGINMRGFSFALLEKIEELALYTLQQEDTIRALQSRLDQLEEQQDDR
jgi:hypothetical protein